MNNPIENLERQLGAAIPNAPPELEIETAKMVQRKIRVQTMVDDIKWIATSVSILCIAAVFQWFLFRNTNTQMNELSNTIASTEAGKRIPVVVGATQFLSPNSTNQSSNN